MLALGAALLGPTGAVAAPAAEGFGKDAWWYKAMGLAQAHKQSTGKGVKIAVIDSKIDISVPELRGQRVIPTQNFCGGPAAGKGSIAGHGTTVAVSIVGSGRGTLPGGGGVIGIAPDATILGFVYSDDSSSTENLTCLGDPTTPALTRAIDASVAAGARIINFSGGTSRPFLPLTMAVQRALDAGVVVVAAAGNGPGDRAVNYPAAIPGVVAAVAVDRNAKPWERNVKRNREAFVISAPGVQVPNGGFENKKWFSDFLVSGTSEAAPLVAGGLALVASKYPSATGNQLIQHLIRNPGGSREFGKDLEYGYGIMSVTKMLASDPSVHPDVNPLIA
ncbi:MAG: S8 family peptidase, partial [Sporichthyaceae bacterium]